jgi:hypothetical protein
MIYLKNTSSEEEVLVKDCVISVARRMLELREYAKEFIMEMTGLTETGYIEAVRREAIMSCAKKLVNHFQLQFFQKEFELNEYEMKDLIEFKDELNKERYKEEE